MFSLCLDKEVNSRNSYNLTSFISDLGGFSACLTLMCGFIINSVLNLHISLENKMMNNVFRRKLPESM
jgi:hypothetical protein